MPRVNVCSKCGKDFWSKDIGNSICFLCFQETQKNPPLEPIVQAGTVYEPTERDLSGYVYIVKSLGYYKIGMTSKQSERVKALRVSLPVLKLINQFACKDRQRVESYLHKKYKKQQVKGEWYKLTKEDIQWLKSLQDYELG